MPDSYTDKVKKGLIIASCVTKCAAEKMPQHKELSDSVDKILHGTNHIVSQFKNGDATEGINKLGHAVSQFSKLIPLDPKTSQNGAGVMYLHGEDLDAYNQYAGAKAKYLLHKSKMGSQ